MFRKSYHQELVDFRDRRRESIKKESKSQPFQGESVKAGKEFAGILCSALREAGVPIISELEDKRRVCKLRTQTLLGHEFRVDLDAYVPNDERLSIGLEIKYMESGIFYIPDTKKIAYDYLHLRESHPNVVYVIISGGRISKTRKSEMRIRTMLNAFSDCFFDFDIEQPHLEKRFNNIVQSLKRISNSKKKAVNPNRISTQTVPTKYFGTIQENGEKISFPEAVKSGFSFEREVKKRIYKQRIPFTPQEGVVYTPYDIQTKQGKSMINIEGDLYIPSHNSPTIIIECKNMRRLSRAFLSSMCFDAWCFKEKFPDSKYYAIIGPRTKPFSTGFLNGYIDGIVYANGIESFLESIL